MKCGSKTVRLDGSHENILVSLSPSLWAWEELFDGPVFQQRVVAVSMLKMGSKFSAERHYRKRKLQCDHIRAGRGVGCFFWEKALRSLLPYR